MIQCRQFPSLNVQNETDLSLLPSVRWKDEKIETIFEWFLRETHTQNSIRTMNSIILGILSSFLKYFYWVLSSFILLECMHRRGSNLHLFIGSHLWKKNESSFSSSSHWSLSTQHQFEQMRAGPMRVCVCFYFKLAHEDALECETLENDNWKFTAKDGWE